MESPDYSSKRRTVELAESPDDLRAALRWMNQINTTNVSCLRDGTIGALKQHALPTSHIFVWKEGAVVRGACTLFLNGPLKTPWETKTERSIDTTQMRYAELSAPLGDPAFPQVKVDLIDFAIKFAKIHCLVDEVYMHLTEEQVSIFENFLTLHEKQEKLYQILAIAPCTAIAEFLWPVRNFYRIGHQQWTPDLFREVFLEKTDIIKSLCDRELQIVVNAHPKGILTPALNELGRRPANLSQQAKHPRHPTLCSGHLFLEGGKPCNVELLDVSKEGMRIRILEGEIELGTKFPMRLAVGPKQNSEVIAQSIWTNGNGEFGLKVLSGDSAWRELHAFLESSLEKRTAA